MRIEAETISVDRSERRAGRCGAVKGPCGRGIALRLRVGRRGGERACSRSRARRSVQEGLSARPLRLLLFFLSSRLAGLVGGFLRVSHGG